MTRLLGLAAFGVIGIPLLAQDAAAPEAANKKLIDKALSQSYLQGKITADQACDNMIAAVAKSKSA